MKYIGYYDQEDYRRLMSPAAVNKMNYIAGVLAKICGKVEIISCGMFANEAIKPNVEELGNNVCVEYFKTLKEPPKLIRKPFKHIYSFIKLFFYLITNVKKNEQVIVYHSLINMYPIYLAKMIKKFRIILEVEEFYNDVGGLKHDSSSMELKYIHSADKYIFPTDIMKRKFGDGKKSVIVHGVYKYNKYNHSSESENKVKVVYAGTFDPNKGGVYAAIECAQYLSKEHEIHIAGFGSESQIKDVKEKIKKANNINDCKIIYEGSIRGKKYDDFLQSCDIGLSTQNPKGTFNDTSFPSKILSYLSNGLRVVSARIPVVETSNVNEAITYYNDQKPEEIAKAIINSEKKEYNPKEILDKLNKKFSRDLEELLKN